MPRVKFPINKFRNGTATSMSDRDAPPESPKQSHNVDPTAESGTLTGLQDDDILVSGNDEKLGWNTKDDITLGNLEEFAARMDKMGIIDDNGVNRLVYYNDSTNNISTVKNIWSTNEDDLESDTLANVGNGTGVSMVSNNKELHIGLGEDRDPYWVGMIENKQFENDYSEVLTAEKGNLEQPSKIVSVHKVVKTTIDGAVYFYAIKWKGTRVYVYDSNGLFVKKLKHRFVKTQALGVYENGTAEDTRLLIYDAGKDLGVIYNYDAREAEDKVDKTHTLPDKDADAYETKEYSKDITDIIYNHSGATATNRFLWIYRPLLNEQFLRRRGNPIYSSRHGRKHLWKAPYTIPSSGDIFFESISAATGSWDSTQRAGDWDIPLYGGIANAVTKYGTDWFDKSGNTHGIASTQGSGPGTQNRFNTGSWMYPTHRTNTDTTITYDSDTSDKWYPKTLLNPSGDNQGMHDGTEDSSTGMWNQIMGIHVSGNGSGSSSKQEGNGIVNFVNFQQCLCKVDTKYGVYFIAGHKYYDIKNVSALRNDALCEYAAAEWHAGHWGGGNHIVDSAGYGKQASDMPASNDNYQASDDPDGDHAIDSVKKSVGWFGGEIYSAGIFSENSDGYDRHVYASNISYPSSNNATAEQDGKIGNTTCVGPYFTHGKHGYVATDKDGDDGLNGSNHYTHGKINRTTASYIFAPMSATAMNKSHIHTTTNSAEISASGLDGGYTDTIKDNGGYNLWAGLVSNHGTLGGGMAWGWTDIGFDNTMAAEVARNFAGSVNTLDSGNNTFNADDKRWRGSQCSDYMGTLFILGFNSMQTGNAGNVEMGQNELGMWSLRRKGYIHSDFYKSNKWYYRGKILQDESNYDTGTENMQGAKYHREFIKEKGFLPGMMKVDTTNKLVFVGGKRRGSYRMSSSGMRNWVYSFNYDLNKQDEHEITEFFASGGLNTDEMSSISCDNFDCFYIDEKDKVVIAGGGHASNNSGAAGIALMEYDENGLFLQNNFIRIPNLSYVFAVDPIRKLIFTSEPANSTHNILEDTSAVYRYNPNSLSVTRIHNLKQENYDNKLNKLWEGHQTVQPCIHGAYYSSRLDWNTPPTATFDYDYDNRIIVSAHSNQMFTWTYDEDGSNFRLLDGGTNSTKQGWTSSNVVDMNGEDVNIPELGNQGANWKYEGDDYGLAQSPGRRDDSVLVGPNESLNEYSKNDSEGWKDAATYASEHSQSSNAHAGIQLTYSDYWGYVKDLTPEETRENGRLKNKAILCPFTQAYLIVPISNYYRLAWNERVCTDNMASETNRSGFGESINVCNGFKPPTLTYTGGYTKTHPWGYGPRRQASPIHYAANRSPVMRHLGFGLDYVTTPKTGLMIPSRDSDKNHVMILYQNKYNTKVWETNGVDSDDAHNGTTMQVRKFLGVYRADKSSSDWIEPFGTTSKAKMYKLDSENNVDNIDYDNLNENLLYTTDQDTTNHIVYLAHNDNSLDDKDQTSLKAFGSPDLTGTDFDGQTLNGIDADSSNDAYNIKKAAISAGNNVLNLMSGDDVLVHGTIDTVDDGSINNSIKEFILKEVADAEIELNQEATLTGAIKNGYKYFYKMSYLYDGYQEGPLSESVETIVGEGKKIKVELRIYDEGSLSKRVSHVLVYRAYSTDIDSETPDGFYRLVKQFRLDTTWGTFNSAQLGNYYVNDFIDDGSSGPSFESSAQIPELLDVVTPKYNLSTVLNSTHFIADITHPDIDKGENMLVKSIPFQFNVFDITNDLIRLPKKPIAISSFNNRVYVFSNNAMFRVEPNNFSIEHTYENVGCLGQDAIVSFDAGLAWADSDNIYLYDGNIPIPIGNAIKTGDDYSWDKRDKAVSPILSYSSKHKSVVVFWKAKNASKWYAWMYNIAMQRWDMANFFTKNIVDTEGILSQTITAHTIRSVVPGKDGDLIYQAQVDSSGNGTPDIDALYRFTSEYGADNSLTSTYKSRFRDIKWKSQELTFGLDGTEKRILEIRVLAKLEVEVEEEGDPENNLYLNYYNNDVGGGSVINIADSQNEAEGQGLYRLFKFKIPKNKQKSLSGQFEVVTSGDVAIESIIVHYRPLTGGANMTAEIGEGD